MTIPVSTVPTIKAALVAGITTAAADAAVSVTYGERDTSRHQNDSVEVNRVNRQVTAFGQVGSGGAGWLSEQYTIEVRIRCFTGSDAETIDARWWALAALVETVVRTDPSFGGVLIQANPETSECSDPWDAEGRVAEGSVYVHCRAQI